MFGEKEIIGSCELKITRNAIYLPDFTNAEENDKVLLMYGLQKEKIIVGNVDKMEVLLEELINYMINDKNLFKEDNRLVRIRKIKRFVYGTRAICDEIIKEKNKLSIPIEVLRTLEIKNKVFVVGNKDRLDIYKDEETYKKNKTK